MNNEKILISIVTVSYNAAKTIEKTILSVTNQTYKGIEYIIIDGGSSDGTYDIIKKYDHYIAYWISEPDNGIYDAMNKGLNIAKGDYVYFLGADDTLVDSEIMFRISNIMNSNINAIYYSNVKFKHSGEIYPGKINSNYRICLDNFSHQAVFYPYHIYKKKKYNTDYKLWADYVYNLELFADKNNKFIYVDDIIAIFACDGRGSVNRDTLFDKNRIKLIKSLFGNRLANIVNLRIKLGKLYKSIFFWLQKQIQMR